MFWVRPTTFSLSSAKQVSCFMGAVAAQRDQAIQLSMAYNWPSWRPPCPTLSSPITRMLRKGLAAGAQKWCRPGQNAGKLLAAQSPENRLNQPAISHRGCRRSPHQTVHTKREPRRESPRSGRDNRRRLSYADSSFHVKSAPLKFVGTIIHRKDIDGYINFTQGLRLSIRRSV